MSSIDQATATCRSRVRIISTGRIGPARRLKGGSFRRVALLGTLSRLEGLSGRFKAVEREACCFDRKVCVSKWIAIWGRVWVSGVVGRRAASLEFWGVVTGHVEGPLPVCIGCGLHTGLFESDKDG
jgi:hypothetical protein